MKHWTRRIEIPEEDAIALLKGLTRGIVRYHGTRSLMNVQVVEGDHGPVYFVEDDLSRERPKRSWRCATLDEALTVAHEHGDYHEEETEQP